MKGARQRKYQQLLELHRGRLSRTDVGLPPLPGRRGGPRPPGLTLAEVDQALPAGSSVYEKVKTGVLRPSPDLLMRLMKLLRFSAHEIRVAHLDLFGTEPALPAEPPSPHWGAVLGAQQEMACALTPGGRLTAWNGPFGDLFPVRVPENLWHWALLTAEAREVLLEWETRWAAPVLAELTLMRYRYPDDAAVRELYEQALDDSRLKQITESDQGLRDEARPLRHPKRGEGTARVMAARAPGGANVLTVLFEAA